MKNLTDFRKTVETGVDPRLGKIRGLVFQGWSKDCVALLHPLSIQASVVQKLDSALHRINLYPVDKAIGFPNTYSHWIVIFGR